MIAKQVRATYEDRAFRPLDDPGVPEGAEVTLIILDTENLSPAFLALIEAPPFESFRGILKGVREDSVSLQHRAKEWWR